VNRPTHNGTASKWLSVLFAGLLIIAFFIPWVSWEGKKVNGADMALGNFFKISEEGFGLTNPFPQYGFITAIVWLIPIAAAIIVLLALRNKKTSFVALLAGIMALSVTTVYFLVTKVLGDLGVSNSMEIGFYITILAAAGIILASTSRNGAKGWLVKIVGLIAGPVIAWGGFAATSSYLENEKFGDTANSSSVYTVNALDFLREFRTNDSIANAKYTDKIITVNGNISSVELPNDSTVNIKFADTTGSYAIFPLHGEEATDAKKLKEGEMVSVKGSCSGAILSEILGIHSITFKRCTLNKE
jgi:hypothetical protein